MNEALLALMVLLTFSWGVMRGIQLFENEVLLALMAFLTFSWGVMCGMQLNAWKHEGT